MANRKERSLPPSLPPSAVIPPPVIPAPRQPVVAVAVVTTYGAKRPMSAVVTQGYVRGKSIATSYRMTSLKTRDVTVG